MEFRPGTCTSCKAHFKIPTSFTANKAKCSKCGGVVEIGSATSEAAKPAATPAKAVSAPVASAAARLAEKPSAPAHATPATGPKPVPARPVPQTPASPGAAKPAAAPAKASPAAKAAPAARPGAAKPAPVAAHKGAHEEEHDDADAHAARRAKLEKKKGPNFALLGGAVVGFAIIGVLVFNFWRKDSEAKAAEAARIAQEKEARNAAAQAERERLAAEEAAAEKKREEERAAKAEAAAKAREEKAAAAAKAREEKAAAAAATADGPVEGFDLTTIPDFGPFEGTTPEQWEEIQATVAIWFDPLAGAKSSKARVKLEENPRQSFPAILNGLKKLNLEDEDGYRLADATQKMLEKICHGHNAGWKYRNEKNWLQYNQKAIKLWCDMWTKASTDEAYWKKLTKQDQAAPEEGANPDAPTPPPQKPDDF